MLYFIKMFLEKFYVIINNEEEEKYNIIHFINKCLFTKMTFKKAIQYSKYYKNYKNINCGYDNDIMNILIKIENI